MKKKMLCTILVLVIALGVVFPGASLSASAAATIVVDSTADTVDSTDGETTLREALAAAKNGDTITFADSLFTGNNPIVITLEKTLPVPINNLTIQGKTDANGKPLVTLDGQKKCRVLEANPPVNMQITNALALYGLTITGGKAAGNGGGVYVTLSATLTNCTFSGNSATVSGGGVYAKYATLTNCTFSGNSAISGRGGGMCAGFATLTNCTGTGNSAKGHGGFFGSAYIAGVNGVTLTNCTVRDNTATSGGGVCADNLVMKNCIVSGNTANREGGGGEGGGGEGGGICSRGRLTLTDCTISGNTASWGGAVSCSDGDYTVTLTNCTINNNTAGGGVWALAKDLIMTNCTVSSNTGGGVYIFGSLTLINSTVTKNILENGYGAGVYYEVSFKPYGSIVSGNIGKSNVTTFDQDFGFYSTSAEAPSASNHYSIIGTPAGYSLNDIFGTASPKLTDNGGETKTILLLSGGSAHNGVLNTTGWPSVPATDQRGVARPQGSKRDIGAVELKSSESATGIRISGAPGNMLVGKSATLKAVVVPIVPIATITWSSSNTSVATVNSSGKVTAKAPGAAKITLKSADGKTASVTITVHRYVSLRIGKTAAIQNGQTTTIDQDGSKPLTIGGRTMLPVRFVGEKMGAKVKYINDKTPIVITYGDKKIELTLGSKELKITQNGKTQKIQLDVAAQKIKGRTFLPLRAIGQALGFDVYYKKDGSAEYVVVNNPKMSASVKSARIAEAKSKLK